MQRILKFFLYIFFLFFTFALLAYAYFLVFEDAKTIRKAHEIIPPLGAAASFLGLYDNSYEYDEVYQIKKRAGEDMNQFIEQRNLSIEKPLSGGQLILKDERENIQLYSPLRTFEGTVGTGITELNIIYLHRGKSLTKKWSIDLEDTEDGKRERKFKVGYPRESMFYGENDYIIEALMEDGKQINKKVSILVNYERIELESGMIFLDTTFVPEGDTKNILREVADFDGEVVYFMSYGCDDEVGAPGILFKEKHQYKTIPACFTFSEKKNYLLRFTFQSNQGDDYYFDIVSPEKGVIYRKYPLFQQGLNALYYNLVFRDNKEGLLKFISGKGDDINNALDITFYDPVKKREVLKVIQTNGNQLLVENVKEKIFIYLYKEWSRYFSLEYPGLRYEFFYRGNRLRGGSLYTLPFQLFGKTKKPKSTFGFKITFDDYKLYLDDGIKTVSFDTLNIGKTIDVQKKELPFNQSDMCDLGEIEIYENVWGKKPKNGISKKGKTWLLVGENMNASNIKILHNHKEIAEIEPYQGYFSMKLNENNNTIEMGNNVYTASAYDERGRRICGVKTSIMVK